MTVSGYYKIFPGEHAPIITICGTSSTQPPRKIIKKRKITEKGKSFVSAFQDLIVNIEVTY